MGARYYRSMIRRFVAVAAGGAALGVTGPARVFAAFERSCYVETAAGIACLGGLGLGLGPLNVIAKEPLVAAIGDEVEIDFSAAAPWQPSSPARAEFRVPVRISNAWKGISEAQAFLAWIRGAGEPDDALIGLGPGLTPAGDDFVGGAMIALHAYGDTALARRIAEWALPLAATRTGRISRAHLACAAQGQGHEALHTLLCSLNDGPAMRRALAKLARIGHTSGLDAAAGALLALGELTRRRSPRPQARPAHIR